MLIFITQKESLNFNPTISVQRKALYRRAGGQVTLSQLGCQGWSCGLRMPSAAVLLITPNVCLKTATTIIFFFQSLSTLHSKLLLPYPLSPSLATTLSRRPHLLSSSFLACLLPPKAPRDRLTFTGIQGFNSFFKQDYNKKKNIYVYSVAFVLQFFFITLFQ